MKRSLYLIAVVLCLFGNVACADYLDKLLSSNNYYKSKIGSKALNLFAESKKYNLGTTTAGTTPSPTLKSDLFYKGRLADKRRLFKSTDWTKQTADEKEKAKNSIQATEDKLHYVEMKIKSFGAYRKALLTAFRFNLPNLNQLMDGYIKEFFK